MKYLEKKLDENYTMILDAFLNKPWEQLAKNQQFYGHLPPILQTIQDEQDRLVIVGEVRMNSVSMFSYGLQLMDTPVLSYR